MYMRILLRRHRAVLGASVPQYVENAVHTDDFRLWVRENKEELQAHGNFTAEKAKKIYRDARYSSDTGFSELSIEDAVAVVRRDLPANVRKGWFVEADSGYKAIIESYALRNPELRNAGLNIAWDNYKVFTHNDSLAFDEFLNRNITVYRGYDSENLVHGDQIMSYSYDRKIAESFGDTVDVVTIYPRDTLGSYQTTGEFEIFVRNS